MGKRDRYEPGTFCWVDLATTDPEGAKAFYSALFGWNAVDMPVGDGSVYTLLRLNGDDVAALSEMQPDMRAQGPRTRRDRLWRTLRCAGCRPDGDDSGPHRGDRDGLATGTAHRRRPRQ